MRKYARFLGYTKAVPRAGKEPHFNVRPITNTNTGSSPGTHGHYNF
ncbi:HNH/endonuclease VII fold putative polymorphic toxin [Aggregatibacter kilianii]